MTSSSFFVSLVAAASLVGSSAAMAAPASGKLSFFACHKEFQNAKKNGTLNGQNYAAFKAAQCSGSTDKAQTSDNASKKAPSSRTSAPVAPVSSGSVVFPSRVSSEFSSLSAGKARQKTCLQQYNANKANGGNGSLKWIQRGGGYYSQCNSRLKGASAQ